MRVLLSIWLIGIAAASFAQNRFIHLANSDWSDPTYNITRPDTLAQLLIAPCKNDQEKVAAIFHWITDNISYRVADRRWNATVLRYNADPLDTAGEWKSLNELVASNVLRKRVAVCDGYARLFKTLCDYAGISSEVITGYARTNINSIGTFFRANHTWNAVYFDSSWHLLDATWASGYVSYRGDEFIKQYDDAYFLPSPQRFIYDHYPENLEWTLLSNPPVLQEYNRTPFKYSAFIKNHIQSFFPAKGIIEVAVGDTVIIELVTDDPQKKLRVTDAMVVDSTELSETDSCNEVKPVGKVSGNKVRYTYKVTSDQVQYLNVILNNEAILRYKLNLQKDMPPFIKK